MNGNSRIWCFLLEHRAPISPSVINNCIRLDAYSIGSVADDAGCDEGSSFSKLSEPGLDLVLPSGDLVSDDVVKLVETPQVIYPYLWY